MDFNPLTKKYTEIQSEIDRFIESEKKIADELQLHNSIDLNALKVDFRDNEAKAEKLQEEIVALEKEVAENKDRINATAAAIGTPLNPANWFSKNQAALRRTLRQLQDANAQRAAQQQLMVKERGAARTQIAEIISAITWYNSLDLGRQQNELLEIRRSLAKKREEFERVAKHKKQVDEKLAEVLQVMQKLESRKHHAESRRRRAEDFRRRLSDANNSYERAMIHQECERELGEGDPRVIVGEQNREMGQIDRDYDKAKRRAEEIGCSAARTIETIVIDGNNLCYEGDKFIGLSAIETLVPILSKNHTFIVVFDSGIRGKLRCGDSQIRERLEGYASVHVVASRQTADETVLGLACANDATYVLSNDRFGEYNEKSVVKGGRIIRHEIVNGYVLVHDLQVSAAYR